MDNNNDVLEWAKKFASAGYYVFPLIHTSGGPIKPFGWARNKNPTHNGEPVAQIKIISATNNPLEVDEWPVRVRSGYKSTVCAYGVLGVGHVLVDLDVKKGKDGFNEFLELSKTYKIPEPTLVVKTKSGGFHLYFKKPSKYAIAEIKTLAGLTLAGRKYSGIDIRGDGGMIIGPTCEGTQLAWREGEYMLIRGEPGIELTEFPEGLVKALTKTVISNDLDNIQDTADVRVDDDVMQVLRRGEIPKVLPEGQRNEGFYAFINGLKNRGIPKDTARVLCDQLAKSCGDPESLKDSVNITDMLNRVYTVDLENPYNMAHDLIAIGLFQLMSYKAKIHYVVLEDNPYLVTRSPHDESAMRVLMARYTRNVMQTNGKSKPVNPIDILIKILPDTNKVDSLGFKPGAPSIFSNSEDTGSRRFLNTFSAPQIPDSPAGLDDTIYDEFKFVVSRIFGSEGSEEYRLGMDFSAWVIQHPGRKPAICPYVMSRNRGVGKSLYIDLMTLVAGTSKIGEDQARLTKIDEIGGRFFDPSMYTLIMFDEVQFPVHKDMRKEATTFWRYMKNLVTTGKIPVEIKGGNTFQLPSLAAFLMAGNSGSNFPIEEFDRRIWVIDNDPPEMAKGLVDRLFLLSKGIGLSHDERRKLIRTIRYHLSQHKIELPLDTMRAPMTEAKRDMYMASLSDIEEWWISHFEDQENLLSKTPILSKSAVIYLIETSERLMNTKYRDDPESTFRDLKRRGLLVPVRTKKDQSQTRNMFGVARVKSNGDICEFDGRECLYTSRNHGVYNGEDNEFLLQMYNENISRIKNWKHNKISNRDVSSDVNALIH